MHTTLSTAILFYLTVQNNFPFCELSLTEKVKVIIHVYEKEKRSNLSVR